MRCFLALALAEGVLLSSLWTAIYQTLKEEEELTAAALAAAVLDGRRCCPQP